MFLNEARSEKELVNLGPPLPLEAPRPPFRPGVVGRIAFFFSIVAGALVSIINLRRMGHPEKAKKVFWLTLLSTVAIATALLLMPDALGRLTGLGLEIAWYFVFPKIQMREFVQWEAAHPDVIPSSGWRALGWGFLGSALFLLIILLVGAIIQTSGIVSVSAPNFPPGYAKTYLCHPACACAAFALH